MAFPSLFCWLGTYFDFMLLSMNWTSTDVVCDSFGYFAVYVELMSELSTSFTTCFDSVRLHLLLNMASCRTSDCRGGCGTIVPRV